MRAIIEFDNGEIIDVSNDITEALPANEAIAIISIFGNAEFILKPLIVQNKMSGKIILEKTGGRLYAHCEGVDAMNCAILLAELQRIYNLSDRD